MYVEKYQKQYIYLFLLLLLSFQESPNLKELNVMCNDLTEKGAAHLAKALHVCKLITHASFLILFVFFLVFC